MWYKKIMSVVLFILIIFLALVFPGQAKTPAPKHEKNGNTESNLMNGGFAAESEGIIYYASDSGIWKINNDNTGKVLISKDGASYLNVMDGWIYYKNSKDSGIFKIKIDGSEKIKICSDDIRSMSIVGSNIYYLGVTGDSLAAGKASIYRIKTDGSEKSIILTGDRGNNISYFSAAEDRLYYTSGSNLIKINMDGTRKIFIAPEYVREFVLSGEWLYYYAYRTFQKDALFRVNVNGGQNSIILEDAGCFNINKNSIYYEKLLKLTKSEKTNSSFSFGFEGKNYISINKRNLDGTDDTKLVDAEAMSINVAGEWIFYTTRTESNSEKLFKIKTDGTQKQQVE